MQRCSYTKPNNTAMEEGKSDLHKERFLPFLKFLKGKEAYLALSGGGLALVCHIAVIRLIETFGIEIKKVYGTSAGAVIGGLYAAGLSSVQMEEAVLKLKSPDDLFGRRSRHFLYRALKSEFQASVMNRGFMSAGIYTSTSLEKYFEDVIRRNVGRVPQLGELKIPFTAVSLNIGSGKAPDIGLSLKEDFSSETSPSVSLKDAMVASLSIPGIFPPKKIKGYYYIDGGVVEHLPIVSAYEDWLHSKRLGRNKAVVIAVNLGYGGARLTKSVAIKPHDMVIYATSIQGKIIDQYNLLRVHKPNKGFSVILLKPRCYDIGLTDFDKIPKAIVKSFDTTLNQLQGDRFLHETEEDVAKARLMLGLGEKSR